MSARRLEALDALARDPAATDAERRLAAEHAARMRAGMKAQGTAYVEDEIDDGLVAALDRAMARAATVRRSSYRNARVRAAKQRVGRAATKAWYDGLPPALGR